MLESVYHRCLVYELRKRGCECVTQRLVPLVYEGIALDATYRLDLLVNEKVVVEIKSVERLLSVHEAQVLTYLRLANSPIGLLINFNVAKLTDGVKRLINPRWRIP